jgi:RND family efflux transporter MFP subunit
MAISRRSARWLLAGAALLVAFIAGARLVDSPAVQVAVTRVRVGALESWITTNGVIEPSEPYVVRAPVTTFLRTVQVVEGQIETRGLVLMTLDLAEQRAELARAREDLAKAKNDLQVLQAGGSATERAQVESDIRKAEVEIAQLRLAKEATERLITKQAATRDELRQTELTLARAEATRDALVRKQQEMQRDAARNVNVSRLAVQHAHEVVSLLEGRIRSADIRAPVDGTVYALPARPGGRVEVGAVLAQVANLGSMQLRAFVDEPELASIQIGQPVEVSWSAVPNRSWTGRTERIPRNVISRGDRMVGEVICSVNNDDRQLIPNLDVDVRVRIQSRSRAMLVLRQAVRTDQSGRYVFVVQNQSIQRRAVVIDGASATHYSVQRGLAEGEQVALPGAAEPRDGMRVRIESEVR